MPELPEVEVIVRELNARLVGEVIKRVHVNWQKSLVLNGNRLPLGDKIESVDRYGKFIIISLDKEFILIHLRMTGQIIINKADYIFSTNHLQVRFDLHSGKRILYYDARKFGRIYLTSNPDKYFKNLGLDALSPDFTKKKMIEVLSRKKSRIKTFLLDQKNIAGLGNIYCDESLFEAGIHPETQANQISSISVSKLYSAIKAILLSAIDHMGTTISDYKTTGGGFGTNQFHLKVYGRENESCYKCHESIKKIRINNRGTHFCPNCQPIK
jgi:formamidopyrimidine-DNA glycosylase